MSDDTDIERIARMELSANSNGDGIIAEGLRRASRTSLHDPRDDRPAIEAGATASNPLADKIRANLFTEADLAALPRPEPLIHGLLDRGALAFLSGGPGSCKTLVALDLAACIGSGTWWRRHRVDKGRVLFVAAESQSDLLPRITAWRAEANILAAPIDITYLTMAVNVFDPGWAGALREVVIEGAYDLIVIDTLARSAVGMDENSNREAGMVIEQLDLIRRETGATVLVVHHTGKDKDKGMRGASAFYGAADTVLAVSRTDNKITVSTDPGKGGKQRSRSANWRLDLWVIEHPVVIDGEREVCVALTGRPVANAQMPDGVVTTLRALCEIEVPGGIASTAWKLSSGHSDGTFYRHRKDLLTLGLVSQAGEGHSARYQVTHTGTLTLSRHSHGSQREQGEDALTLTPLIGGESVRAHPPTAPSNGVSL